MRLCDGTACTNLYAAAVALFSRLQEGIPTHRPAEDAICRGRIQQTGRVDLVQEPAKLLLAAATEQLWIHDARKKR